MGEKTTEQKGKSTEIITISTEFIKLDSFLKFAGAAETGGHAKMMIEEGVVLVDGVVCQQRGKKIYPGMKVACEDMLFEVAAS